MKSLINTVGNDSEYLEFLIEAVRAEQKEAQDAIPFGGKTVSVRLVHEYQLLKKPRSVANLRYNTDEHLPNGHVNCNSYLEKLEEGENYSFDPINNLIGVIIEAVNRDIDMAAMCGDMLEADVINDKVKFVMTSILEGLYIFDGVSISSVVMANELTEIIVTVC